MLFDRVVSVRVKARGLLFKCPSESDAFFTCCTRGGRGASIMIFKISTDNFYKYGELMYLLFLTLKS
jgi:hypothetical protein